MSRIRSKDTLPELLVRSVLHRFGLRFRIHEEHLPGEPDIVLKKYRVVVFVHGCYWHRHPGCCKCTTPTTRKEFWEKKFDANVTRDYIAKQQLESLGWSVIVLWECEVIGDPEGAVRGILTHMDQELASKLCSVKLPPKRDLIRIARKKHLKKR